MQEKPSLPSNKCLCLFYRRKRIKPYTTTRMPYDDYLQTDVWRELRNERLRLDHYQCQYCGTAQNVEVHHLRYPLEAWGTEDVETDLITLCSTCHAETHKHDIANRQ